MTTADIAGTLRRVASQLPGGGEDRPGQQDMAEAVAGAMEKERHLVVQAGTGTGKSLAYAVPAALSGRKVVVATATKALQDQLATKDLPSVAAALDVPLDFAVLKGRSNYLCRQRAAEVAGEGHQQALDEQGAGPAGETGRLVDQLRRLLRWGAETSSGDRADLDFEPHPRAWAMVSVGPRECPGAQRCPSGDRCFAEQARRRAADADVVVVNTHLYGAHLASGGTVLPPHEVVVFDEAHEVEEVMTASLGVDLSPGRLTALHAAARPIVGDDASTDLADVGERLRAALSGRIGERVLRAALGPAATGAIGGGARGGQEGSHGEPAGRERSLPAAPPGRPAGGVGGMEQRRGGTAALDGELAEVLELATIRVEEIRRRLQTDGSAAGPAADAGRNARVARALTTAGHLADDLARLAGRGDDDVVWVDGGPVLRLSPIDVGPLLSRTVWAEATAVLTSATIPPRLAERLGMEETDQLDVGSPFDYRAHSLLYVARHLPDRRRPEAEPAIHDELEALIAAAGGRTLALFTSRRAAEAAAKALDPRLPYRILVQGDLPKGRLLERFSDEEQSCLFATLGFWQGVDVPGRSCSLVTLDRLPFGRPDDPLLEARRERAGDAAFRLVDLPRAATLLAQGVGRLIRSSDDHGVVAVLDPRLATAGYRKVLLDALPPMRRTVDRGEVARFLAGVLGEPAVSQAVPAPAGSRGRSAEPGRSGS